MLELRGHRDLAPESLGTEGDRQIRVQDLQRHGAIVLHVAGDVHRCHPAAANLTLNRVAAC